MSKKNLPNIPIYIGDWERDCNVLSLESEAAWLRLVFKMWTKGKQSSIKIPTKALQNLWRCDGLKMQEIVDELLYNEICEIAIEGNFIEFTCRRFVKENNLSEIRREAKKGSTKPPQKDNKTGTKSNQNTDYDIDNENDIDNESKSEIVLPWETENFENAWAEWKSYKVEQFKFRYKPRSEKAALTELNKLTSNEDEAIRIIHQSISNGWKGFFELKENGISKKQGFQQVAHEQLLASDPDYKAL